MHKGTQDTDSDPALGYYPGDGTCTPSQLPLQDSSGAPETKST